MASSLQKQQTITYDTMIKSFLLSAFRSLTREKSNTLINIAGLTLGITGSLVLFLFINEGFSYDTYHTKKDRIYRIVSKSKGNNGVSYTQGIPTVLPEAFRNDFPEAEAVAFTSYRRGNLIGIVQRNGELKKYEEPKGVAFTQPSFFTLFDRTILRGVGSKSLEQPNQAIISKKWALKYFATDDVLGEVVKYDNIEYKIGAVMEDYPTTTDLPFDLILSAITIQKSLNEKGWGDNSDTDNCYFLLRENESIHTVESRLASFTEKFYGKGDKNPNENGFLLQPLSTLHSDARFGNYNTKMPQAAAIAFGVIAVFLLITCCINFVNLTTASAIKRTKEVGIRKVLGSTRQQLIYKLLGESFLITILSVFTSLAAAQLFLAFLNPMLDMNITLQFVSNWRVPVFLMAVTGIVVLLSGLYPALVVSSYKPVLALKNLSGTAPSSGYTLRRSLVVLQFFISQFFIISTIVITQQLNFIQHQDVGFAQEAIVTIPIPVGEDAAGKTPAKMRALKNEIALLSGVEKASLNLSPPSHRSAVGTSFTMAGKEDWKGTQLKSIDGDYLDLYKIKVVAGERLADRDTISGVLVNEKLANVAGFTSEEIVGKEIVLWDRRFTVHGVVKDFNTKSLSEPIEPVILYTSLNSFHSLSVKLNPTDMQATLGQIKTKWEAAYPEYIFNYEFLDEQVRNLYRGERRISTLLTIFSSIAIFIGCLGLFGLVTFMANQKTKEIGVRKVLGANTQNIVILFSKEFAKLIVIGFLFAAPAAGFVMNKVLEQFAYKIELGPSIFLTGIVTTFLIAFATVGFRSVKAALTNPVDALRAE
jgi:ABC-type antimicrobial peptide transport system permease subunit